MFMVHYNANNSMLGYIRRVRCRASFYTRKGISSRLKFYFQVGMKAISADPVHLITLITGCATIDIKSGRPGLSLS